MYSYGCNRFCEDCDESYGNVFVCLIVFSCCSVFRKIFIIKILFVGMNFSEWYVSFFISGFYLVMVMKYMGGKCIIIL